MGGNLLAFAAMGPHALALAVCGHHGNVLCDVVCAVLGIAQDFQAGVMI